MKYDEICPVCGNITYSCFREKLLNSYLGIRLKMATHLKNNGRLVITALNCPGETEDNPMRLKMEFDAEGLLNSLGIFKTDRDWLWLKKV